MLFYGVLAGLLVTASAQYCYDSTVDACTSPLKNNIECNAKFGKIDSVLSDLQSYAMASIDKSYEFLLMSSHFGSYETNREGFKKLYRKLSDKAWEDAIDVIKYITQRGGSMNFMEPPRLNNPDGSDVSDSSGRVFELIELDSLAKALDNEKKLANKALYIHEEAQHQANKMDAGVAHYIEEHLIEPLSETVRHLAGYTNDLKNMLTVHEHNDARGVAVFMFDEYLSKSL